MTNFDIMNIVISSIALCICFMVTNEREEMGVIELYRTTIKVCYKDSDKLWEKVISCHQPIDEEVSFLIEE